MTIKSTIINRFSNLLFFPSNKPQKANRPRFRNLCTLIGPSRDTHGATIELDSNKNGA